jgi:predicted transcriptional regulator
MGFRESLDLSGIVKDYEAFGGTAPRPATAIPIPEEAPLSKYPVQYGLPGTVLASSHTGLAPFRPVVWDVNGYYRALGVRTDATRKELREAYQALRGDESVRLTYVFGQLLNEAVRRSYDATPLGEQFLDEYVEADMKRRASAEAGRRTAEAGEPILAEEVLDDWGYYLIPDLTSSESGELEQLDNPPPPKQDWRYQEIWGWGYYLWRTRDFDIFQLRNWQALLVAELSARGCSVRFAVGIGGEIEGGVGFNYGDHFVFFIPALTAPTEEMAFQVVDQFLKATQSD